MRKVFPVQKGKLTFLLLLIALSSFAQPRPVPLPYDPVIPLNYVRSWQVQAPLTDPNQITATTAVDSAIMTTQYLDGLGRPIQTVVKQASPRKMDMVTPVLYDEFGREQFTYLPFTATPIAGAGGSVNDGSFKYNAFQQQSQFMQTTYGPQGETYFYGQTVYEPSPLNRVSESFAPGNSWMGTSADPNEANHHSIKTKYWINTTLDSVKMWKVTNSNTIGVFGSYTKTGDYPAGELYKNVTIDEQNHQTVEYKDKEGQVILKKVQLSVTAADGGNGSGYSGWLSTYYIYDDLNQLRAVISPKAVEAMTTANNWTLTADMLNELCFRYEYDQRGRMIMKKVPGAGEVYMIYDARDRLIMTQDANMRVGDYDRWLITHYDELNRPVETGLLTDAGDLAYHAAQAYNSTSYPNTSGANYELLTQTGYDTYSTVPSESGLNGSIDKTYITSRIFVTAFVAPDFAHPIVQSQQTTGMVTWTKVKVLNSSPVKYLYTVNIYDEKGRVTQVKSTNYSGGTDLLTTQYTFSGLVYRTHMAHRKAGTNAHTYEMITSPSYGHMGRLLYVVKRPSVDGVSIANRTPTSYTYNESGQISSNQLGLVPNATPPYPLPIETLTYQYNIRGWLLSMNRPFVRDTASTVNHFGFELSYDKTAVTINGINQYYSAGQYNGNITGMVWKSIGDGQVRRYAFGYDNANRLTGAAFSQFTNQSFNLNAGIDYSVSNLSYDGNGNILTQSQKGWRLSGSKTIDSLLYTYQPFSNQLQNVWDRTNDTATKLGDFRSSKAYMTALGGSKNTAAIDYNYDDNGSLISDKNKDITAITYNYLNLPQLISISGKGSIEYVYDAAGNKLKKIVQETGKPDQTTLYIAGAVYQNDTLQFISHEEGRIRYKSKSGQNTCVYDYFLKDHLGNVRMVLTEDHQTDAYPAATMETANATTEDSLYSNLPSTRSTLPSGYPVDNSYSNPNESVAKVNGSGQKIGPAMVLKVMAGDKFNVRVSSWYKLSTSIGQPVDPLTELVDALAGSIAPLSGGKATISGLQSSTPFSSEATKFLDSHNNYVTTRPKAYLNWVLFDEQFNYVSTGSGSDQVPEESYYNNATATPRVYNHIKNGIAIPKSGYLYIYVSNESEHQDVFFDNLQVTHIHGPLLEETHYYPFGLTMAGISSKAVNGAPENKHKFNGIEQNNDFDLNMYDAFYRNLDPQLGRFWQIDPKPTDGESPYAAMGNNPIRNMDPLGDTIIIRYMSEGKQVESIYQDGSFSKRDGTALSKDDNGYGSKAYSDLYILDNLGDKTISSRIDVLEDSKNLHFIEMPAAGDNNGNSPASTEDDKKGKPTGSTTKYDPDAKTNARGDKRDPIVGLAHELLGHGYDSDQGKSNYNKTKNGIPMYEVSGVNIENHARAKTGDPKKTTYSGLPIPANLLDDTHKKKKP